MPTGFCSLIVAQFFSALADNALLIVAIAHLEQTGQPVWWAPLLKFFFTLAYVLLAPVVGPLADSMPKARLMAAMNGVKMLGVAALCAGLHPLAALAVVGLGAAAYAPAKYGLLSEIVPAQALVRANAWLEVSVVGAVLLGAVCGGLLVSQWLPHSLPGLWAWAQGVAQVGLGPQNPLGGALVLLLAIYGLSALLNVVIPDSGARYAPQPVHPLALCRQFLAANRLLWRDARGGRLSLMVTTLFWGVGGVLQFAVLRLATDVMGLPLSQGAYLQAVVAVGVVVGAFVAGRWIGLAAAPRVLPAGILFGLLVMIGASVSDVGGAIPVLAAVGAVGGVLVVPMNALLQHRGFELLSAGRSVAVQGFNENAGVLLFLGVYAVLLRLQCSIVGVMFGLGLLLTLLMAVLSWQHRVPRWRAQVPACD